MWKDTTTFIRVVRTLTSSLTDVELGQDPTVLSPYVTQILKSDAV